MKFPYFKTAMLVVAFLGVFVLANDYLDKRDRLKQLDGLEGTCYSNVPYMTWRIDEFISSGFTGVKTRVTVAYIDERMVGLLKEDVIYNMLKEFKKVECPDSLKSRDPR